MASPELCDIRDCDLPAIVFGALELPDGDHRIGFCHTHLPRAAGGAIFLETLKPTVKGRGRVDTKKPAPTRRQRPA